MSRGFSVRLIDQVHAVWGEMYRARGAIPARTAVSPAAFREALPCIALLDVVPGECGADFRYRMLGQHLIESFGANVTGELHSTFRRSEVPGPLRAAYLRCIEEQKPIRFDAVFRGPDNGARKVSALICPLSADGEAVDAILGCGIFRTLNPDTDLGPLIEREQALVR